MELKEKMLTELEKRKGEYISGEELAEKFGVSRGAIWKAVKSLRKEGTKIDAITNKGYALSFLNERLTAAGIQKFRQPLFYIRDIAALNACIFITSILLRYTLSASRKY